MNLDLGTIGGWVVAVIVAGIAAISRFIPTKGTLEHQLIDQLQEQIEGLTARIAVLEARDEERVRVSRVKDDYIVELRQHISDEKPPPAPPWPDLLRRAHA